MLEFGNLENRQNILGGRVFGGIPASKTQISYIRRSSDPGFYDDYRPFFEIIGKIIMISGGSPASDIIKS
jgi:hypothetical protein